MEIQKNWEKKEGPTTRRGKRDREANFNQEGKEIRIGVGTGVINNCVKKTERKQGGGAR